MNAFTDESPDLAPHDALRFRLAVADARPMFDRDVMADWTDAQLLFLHSMCVDVVGECLREERPAVLRAARYAVTASAIAEVAAARTTRAAALRSQLVLEAVG